MVWIQLTNKFFRCYLVKSIPSKVSKIQKCFVLLGPVCSCFEVNATLLDEEIRFFKSKTLIGNFFIDLEEVTDVALLLLLRRDVIVDDDVEIGAIKLGEEGIAVEGCRYLGQASML